MQNSGSNKSITDILKDPSQWTSIVNNPGKYGLDFYKSMSNQNKMYLTMAAGVGLIIYGLTLRKKS